ncbi:hypothetical protein OF83DRAFT_1227145 [Amylostereum chailletii]|nr:hypothetical protein OF83DRAFT_1227145 [Amylostereum chailletii]
MAPVPFSGDAAHQALSTGIPLRPKATQSSADGLVDMDIYMARAIDNATKHAGCRGPAATARSPLKFHDASDMYKTAQHLMTALDIRPIYTNLPPGHAATPSSATKPAYSQEQLYKFYNGLTPYLTNVFDPLVDRDASNVADDDE